MGNPGNTNREIPADEPEPLQQGINQLGHRLPEGWSLKLAVRSPGPESTAKAAGRLLKISGPDQISSQLRTEFRARVDPRTVLLLAHQFPTLSRPDPCLVVAPYLSAPTQRALRSEGMNYLDLTGNIWISLTRPGLYLEVAGATEEPDRKERPARSLKGPKAGRVIRALLDQKAISRVRSLAARAGVDPGYVSRVLTFLSGEALVERSERGELLKVDWEALLRRWAADGPLDKRRDQTAYLDPRGLSGLMARLKSEPSRYAVTASMAAVQWAPIAPPRLLVMYTDQRESLAERHGLRPAATGANVILIKPADEFVYEGILQRDGIRYAAVTQVAADLLTSPGRGPAEGEELLAWMRAHEEDWRG